MPIAILTLSSLIFIRPINSEITKPSVPEFTVKLFDSSYDILPISTIDPFTGRTITYAGSHVEAKTIEIRIKNEPFTPFPVTEGTSNWTAYFFYNIRWKGHYEQDWHEIYSPSNGFLPRDEGSETVYSNQGEYSSSAGLKLTSRGMYITLPPRAEVDFQVEAMIGYTHRVVEGGMAPWYFFGEKSGWTNTQTLTITETAPTPITSQNPTTTPSPSDSPSVAQSDLDWMQVTTVVLLGVIAVLLVFVVLYLRKRSIKTALDQESSIFRALIRS
ncbi:MAG: hypothetical protein NWE95_06775 [Candidatus Bathyarchaeota archaeon]|nr:hypothetical protein [Candidatus Bathyarchaeota archaeon]